MKLLAHYFGNYNLECCVFLWDNTENREKRQSLKIRTGAGRQAGNPRGKLFTSINAPATSPLIQDVKFGYTVIHSSP